MKRILSIVLCVSMAVFMFAGCAAPAKAEAPAATAAPTAAPAADAPAATAAPAAEAKTYKIGVLMKNLSDQFVKNIADAMDARAKELPEVELIMQDAEGDISKQLAQCEALVTQGVDAIILNAMDAEGLGAAVDMCKEKGIPIIECNTLTSNTNYDTYVGSNDVDAGKIQGGFMKELLGGKGNVCVMYGPIGQSPQVYRKQGVEESLLSVCPDVKLLADQTAEWKRDKALALAEDWLTRFPELNAIICQNDDMAMGALQAVEAKGLLGKVAVVGIDAIPDALQAVKDGKLNCTVFQDSKGQGAQSVDVALKWAKGEKVDKEVLIPFQLVTKDNVDQFMGKNAQ